MDRLLFFVTPEPAPALGWRARLPARWGLVLVASPGDARRGFEEFGPDISDWSFGPVPEVPIEPGIHVFEGQVTGPTNQCPEVSLKGIWRRATSMELVLLGIGSWPWLDEEEPLDRAQMEAVEALELDLELEDACFSATDRFRVNPEILASLLRSYR